MEFARLVLALLGFLHPSGSRRARAWSAAALLGVGAGLSTQACAEATPTPCEINSDCEVGFYCGDLGKCFRECRDPERDCLEGQVCNSNGRCEDAGAGGAGATSSSSGSTSTSSSSTTTATTSTASTTTVTATSSSTGGAAAGELDLCASDGDCGGGLHCRQLSKGGAMRCTRACASTSQCPSGLRCDDPGDGLSVCLASDIGRTCSTGADCHFACIPGPQTCTEPCASGSDCPNGYGCMEFGGQKVCAKAEAYCDSGDSSACVVPAACDLSPNMILGGCTTVCNTAADCPRRANGFAPWTCDGICRRPGDVYGPLGNGYKPAQYYCNASSQVVNLCNDAQHIDFDAFTIPPNPPVNCTSGVTTDGGPTDSCVDSCRYQGGCSAGFACTAVGNLSGQRIGLCLPTGFQEVGASCTHDRDCAFGYCSQNKCSRDCTADGLCPTGSSCTAVGGVAPTVEGQPFRRCQ